jgi:hypothetical protein
VPLTIAGVVTIVARYFISDPGCDYEQIHLFSPRSCGSCQYLYRHQDAETAESSINQRDCIEYGNFVFLQLYA